MLSRIGEMGAQGITYVDLCDPPYRRDLPIFDHIMMLKNGKIQRFWQAPANF